MVIVVATWEFGGALLQMGMREFSGMDEVSYIVIGVVVTEFIEWSMYFTTCKFCFILKKNPEVQIEKGPGI